jgi:riboflavin kinase/FMN adenylyltransferase
VDLIHYPGDERPGDWTAPVLALGNFDGLHLGHREILRHVRRTAEERSATPVVLTFDPHPTHVIRPDKAPPELMTRAQKLEAFEAAGMQGVAMVRFTAEMSRWDPETFVRDVLAGWLGVASVWVGGNFLFGRDRSGTFDVLRVLGEKYGFVADKVDPICVGGAAVSSTRIRHLIAGGNVADVAALLGGFYFVDGEVIHGDGRGRQIGYPTANLRTGNELLPPYGVYASIARVGGDAHPAVTNLGTRPTFHGDGAPSLETHLPGVDKDLYGQRIRLYFVRRIRDERRFESVEALVRQIEQDCREAGDMLSGVSV